MASKISFIWNNIFNNQFKNVQRNIHHNIKVKMDPIFGLKEKRIDYTHLKIYSIDPENCTDADDAFSIYKDNNFIHLMIHIADPTSYFNPNDLLFNDILKNGATVYLSNREPDHLFPSNILEECSLVNGIKNVIIIHTIMLPDFEIVSSKVEFGIINCDNGYRYSYDNAPNNLDETLLLGLDIAKSFRLNRINTLNDLTLVVPTIKDDCVILKPDTPEVRLMKNMICEFAIHANTIFASELDIDNLFLRKLELCADDYNNLNSIHDLIKDGISANYTTIYKMHDLIGTNKIYTHSTSPLRRTSDCIVHFLLKSKYLNIEAPFSKQQLEIYSEHLNKKSKDMKNIQFKDFKLRTFQWIAEELECRLNPIKIRVKNMGIHGPFINLMIIKIDDMDVNISYTLKNSRKIINIDFDEINIDITKINNYNKFDEGTLPELDNIINKTG